jgi:hypothetical protein
MSGKIAWKLSRKIENDIDQFADALAAHQRLMEIRRKEFQPG